MNIDQMKRSIHIRCTQQFVYFESHTKSLKQLCTHYCLFQCTFYQFRIYNINIFYYRGYLEEISRYERYRVLQKIKLSTNRGRITFPWIWGLTGTTFARRKCITITKYT